MCDDPDGADPYIVALLQPDRRGRRSARSTAGRPRGAPVRTRGERHRDLPTGAMRSPCRPPATTSGCAMAIADRTPAGWVPTARSPDLPDGAVGRYRRHDPSAAARRARPTRHARSAASSTPASCSPTTARSCSSATPASATRRPRSILPRLAGPLGPVLLAAARGDLGPVKRVIGSDSHDRMPSACRSSRARRSGSCSPRRATRTRPAGATPSTGLEEAAARGALVFHAGTIGRPGGGYGTNGGRVADGRRPRARPGDRPGRRRASGRRDRLGRSPAPARHRGRRLVAGRRRGSPDDPALHAARDGRDLDRGGPVRGECSGSSSPSHAPRSARGLIPADALAAIEQRATVDVERIAEIERTTDHDVIAFVSQVAESDRTRGPLSPSRADQQRRRRHRPGASSSAPPASDSWPTAIGSSAR